LIDSANFIIILGLIVILTYSSLWVLGQFEWFRKYKEMGATFAFEAVLIMVFLILGFMGLWFNGYEKGYEDGKKST